MCTPTSQLRRTHSCVAHRWRCLLAALWLSASPLQVYAILTVQLLVTFGCVAAATEAAGRAMTVQQQMMVMMMVAALGGSLSSPLNSCLSRALLHPPHPPCLPAA